MRTPAAAHAAIVSPEQSNVFGPAVANTYGLPSWARAYATAIAAFDDAGTLGGGGGAGVLGVGGGAGVGDPVPGRVGAAGGVLEDLDVAGRPATLVGTAAAAAAARTARA
jgi:hypothetical protein